MNKTVTFADLYPIIKEQLDAGGKAAFVIHGTSMLPMLKNGIDSVRIKKPEGRLKKYDIPFYRRKDGAFVLHRIVKVKNDSYVCRGDNQTVNEHGVTDDMIIGVVEAFTDNEKWIDVTDVSYIKYAKKRVNTVFFLKLSRLFKALKRRIFGKG